MTRSRLSSAGLAQAVFRDPDQRQARLRQVRRALTQVERLLEEELRDF